MFDRILGLALLVALVAMTTLAVATFVQMVNL